jgi:hypothetical protein
MIYGAAMVIVPVDRVRGQSFAVTPALDYIKSSRKSSSRSWLLDSARLSSVMISS